jgi:hypothetical protein
VLVDPARDWHTAAEIRSFVATVLGRVTNANSKIDAADRDQLDRRASWALKCADELDPTVSGIKIPPEPNDDDP